MQKKSVVDALFYFQDITLFKELLAINHGKNLAGTLEGC